MFLHSGTTKTGNPRYWFAPGPGEGVIDELPEGYEVYEHPNAQVFLRRVQPAIITPDELDVIKKAMDRYCSVKPFRIDVKKNMILIYVADQDLDALAERLSQFARRKVADLRKQLEGEANYSALLRFELTDPETRTFAAERYCFLGSIDDWVRIGRPGSLGDLAKEYVPHLGKDSYYELM